MIPSGVTLRIPIRYRDPTTKVGVPGLTVTCDIQNAATGAALVTGASASAEAAVSGGYYYEYTTLADLPMGIWVTGHTTALASAVEAKDVWSWIGAEPALDVKLSTRSSHSAADVWAVGARTLTSFGTLVADVAAAVWAVATSTWTVAGTAGKYILDQLGLITTSRVVTVSPVVGDVMTIYRGADHNNADGSAFDLPTTKTLTGGAITVVLKAAGAAAADVTYTSSTGTSVPSANVARLELTSTQTTAIAAKGKYRAIWKHTPQGTTRLDVIGDGFAIVEDL